MKKILINKNPWQIRIAISDNSTLQNIYFSAQAVQSIERVFFKGKVTKVLPGIQTAFVNIGQEKAGFLHISEVDRELALGKFSKHISLEEDISKKTAQLRQSIDISKIFKEGDEVLVQVSKEPVYEKGAKLTTCFTLPGRFIVLMPNIPRIGVSKKIEDRQERVRLKEIVKKNLPESMGAIIRTTSDGRKEWEIVKDISILVSTWETIQNGFKEAKPQERVYEDIELTLQIVRDHLDNDVEAIIVDSKDTQRTIYNYVKKIAPEHRQKIKLYRGKTPIFEYYTIEEQIEAALEKKVPLKSGGSLIIETTEAMSVIDVNTGKFTGKKNMADTMLQTNLEAAEETVRQLRLRNIGGLIVIDFIDMAAAANRKKLITFFEKTLKERDKFQSVVLKVSEFGLVQMTRKRSGKTLVQQLTETCPTCEGSGFIKSVQTQSFTILHAITQELKDKKISDSITISLHPDIFKYITTAQYDAVLTLENFCSCRITFVTKKNFGLNQYKIEKK
ncbi:Rne/Rng family ribonuclease [Candidatus Dependentiae bacterium]|nr:Rne/Rng family ribonuclease [Candidatus Dependentiae bacterium]